MCSMSAERPSGDGALPDVEVKTEAAAMLERVSGGCEREQSEQPVLTHVRAVAAKLTAAPVIQFALGYQRHGTFIRTQSRSFCQ